MTRIPHCCLPPLFPLNFSLMLATSTNPGLGFRQRPSLTQDSAALLGPSAHKAPEKLPLLRRLPVELLIEIAQYCPQQEKSRLCLTSQHLKVITTKELYKNIRLSQPRTTRVLKLYAFHVRVHNLFSSLSKSSLRRNLVETLEIEGLW